MRFPPRDFIPSRAADGRINAASSPGVSAIVSLSSGTDDDDGTGVTLTALTGANVSPDASSSLSGTSGVDDDTITSLEGAIWEPNLHESPDE